MPTEITNQHHNMIEDTFEYILRHTMYRPRQLQMHLHCLAQEYPGGNIDPSMIPKSVSNSCKELARYFVEEYRIDHPNLEKFIQSFHLQNNVMPYKTFRDKVHRAIRKFHGSDYDKSTDGEIDRLYATGMFGFIGYLGTDDRSWDGYLPPTRNSSRHFVQFFYKEPYPHISSVLDDNAEIALHPMFVDFANLRPHPSLIIG